MGKNTALSKMKILAVTFALVALSSGFKIETKKAQLITQAKNNQCGPDETSCPGGCCPDAYYCAATAADCPYVAKRLSLVKLAKSKQCGPDQTDCGPGGCCPEANWFCCPDPDPIGCAANPADCP